MAPHHQIRPGIDILPCQRSLVFLRLCIPLDSPVYIDDKVIALPCAANLIRGEWKGRRLSVPPGWDFPAAHEDTGMTLEAARNPIFFPLPPSLPAFRLIQSAPAPYPPDTRTVQQGHVSSRASVP